MDQRADTTAYGGLALAHGLATALGVAEAIDEHVEVLKLHMPYHESDHLLAQAYNLFVGGTCLQDLQNLQDAEAVKRLLGAVRLPDPTTAGDFLRRFDAPPARNASTAYAGGMRRPADHEPRPRSWEWDPWEARRTSPPKAVEPDVREARVNARLLLRVVRARMAEGRVPLEHEAALRDVAEDERVQVRRRRVAAQLHAELRIRAIKRLAE